MLLGLAILMFVIAAIAHFAGRHTAAQGIAGIGAILLIAWLVVLLFIDSDDGRVNTASVLASFGFHRLQAGTWRLLT